MTEADAAEWARKNGYDRIEKVPGSERRYEDVDGRQDSESVDSANGETNL